jgi:hypothetical protein
VRCPGRDRCLSRDGGTAGGPAGQGPSARLPWSGRRDATPMSRASCGSWPFRTAGARRAGRPGSSPRWGWPAIRPVRALCPGRCRGTAAYPGRDHEEDEQSDLVNKVVVEQPANQAPLPCTCSSRPGFAFSSPTAAASSPERTVVFAHRGSVSVVDATYLGRVFNASPMGFWR